MRRKKKKPQKKERGKEPKNKWAEIITYAVIIFLALLGIISGYMMSQEFEGMELQENGHFKKIENEK